MEHVGPHEHDPIMPSSNTYYQETHFRALLGQWVLRSPCFNHRKNGKILIKEYCCRDKVDASETDRALLVVAAATLRDSNGTVNRHQEVPITQPGGPLPAGGVPVPSSATRHHSQRPAPLAPAAIMALGRSEREGRQAGHLAPP